VSGELRVAGFFSGTGGIELGFTQAGFKVVYANEFDKYANETYRANFGDAHLDTRDIRSIHASEVPDHDVLVAGFPCQAFSKAGKQLGFGDERGVLFLDVARILRKKRPAAFLLENVKGLVAHDDGNTFKVIKETLEREGYHIKYRVINAAEYGVPQRRQRIYLVGFRDELAEQMFSFPEPTYEPTKVADILESEVDDKLTLSDESWAKCHIRTARKQAKSGGQAYSVVSPDDAAVYTVTNPRYLRNMVLQEGKNPRKMSGRECFNAQGYPEDFVLPVSEAQLGKQAGNAVVVPVIRMIATQLAEAIQAANQYYEQMEVAA
jgi:DNA (cytosine-5)-methyltransferase 1